MHNYPLWWKVIKLYKKAEKSEELLKALDSLIFNQKHQSQNL